MALTLATLFTAASGGRGSNNTSSSTDDTKAALILNLANFVRWPEAIEDSSKPFLIGVVGSPSLSRALQQQVEEKTASHRKVVVRELAARDDDITLYHIIYIAPDEEKYLRVSKVLTRPSLTVGESAEFLKAGGIVRLVPLKGKYTLRINRPAARRVLLSISSKLLRFSDSSAPVDERPPIP